MARKARNKSIDPGKIQIVHVWNRCVRRAYLCGFDRATGKSFDHRKQWAQDRLKHLASIFAIDCITYSIMSNHTHQVLRSRPDIVAQWNDREVAIRWLKITPSKDKNGRPREPRESAIQCVLNEPGKVKQLREQLSDVSWWMKCFSQHIATRSNREDEVTGHFWEARFGSEVIESETSLLNCMIYVDLNPIRAGVAETPEESDFTGAKDRIDDLRISLGTTDLGDHVLTFHTEKHSLHDWERLDNEHSGWLSPIEIDELNDPLGADVDSSKRRASQKGVLALSLAHYLRILDWVGREVRSDKRGAIPKELKPILQRLGFSRRSILASLRNFGRPDLHRTPPVCDNGSLSWLSPIGISG